MEEDRESLSSLSCEESVDLDYFKEMYKYEVNAKRETESIEMSLEEENLIVCKIKEDILNQVRDEMGSELEKYQLNTGRTNATLDTFSLEENDHMDPIIRKGLYQIKKLDKILLRKMQKEKEVKRERILLQKRLREELNEIENNNKQLSKEIKTNVMKFLALKPPPRHNEGMNEDTGEDEIPKLFQTEINSDETITINNKNSDQRDSTDFSQSKPSTKRTENLGNQDSYKENSTENRQSANSENGLKKNFIRRNIELASKASEPILLTDAEKSRLDYLLADLELEIGEDSLVDNETLSVVNTTEDNPFQMVTLGQFSNPSITSERLGTGCQSIVSRNSDINSLQYQLSVESRLRMYMGENNYKQLSRIDDRSNFSDHISYQLPQNTDLEIDVESLGEKSLKEVKFSRESQKKLQEIDDNLSKLKDNQYAYQLDEKSLQILINSSRDTISQSNMSNISDFNSDNEDTDKQAEFKIEHLSQEILDSLLNEARQFGIPPRQLTSLSEITEMEENEFTNSSDLLSRADGDSIQSKIEKSSRFPDINLYKQMTSPPPNF